MFDRLKLKYLQWKYRKGLIKKIKDVIYSKQTDR